MSEPLRIAVLGAGGLGKAACRIIGMKRELRMVAICDSRGVLHDPSGLPGESIANYDRDLVAGYEAAHDMQAEEGGGVAPPPADAVKDGGFVKPAALWAASAGGGVATATRTSTVVEATADGIGRIVEWASAGTIDGVLLALPNLPNDFLPGVVRRFFDAGCSVAVTDALKRTQAMELTLQLDPLAKHARAVYLTGCGATPGLLTAAAVLAAQSFITVEHVDIFWGVGIANWEAHNATIREDIAHLPGFTIEQAQAMTDAQIEALLDQTNGILRLQQMEHADDVLLQRAGVVEHREQVTVGGVMDTRHAKKPVSTTMTLTGTTFEGRRASHRFILGDETSMAANVIGPALGYLKRAHWLQRHGIFGVFGSTEFMPMVVK